MNPHGLLDGTPPAPRSRGKLQRAESRTVAIAAFGSVWTLAPALGPHPLDALALGAPIVGLVVLMVGLMALFLENWPDRLVRAVLLLAAASLTALGVFFLGESSLYRVVVGCFAPAALFAAAGIDLALSRRAPRIS